MKQQLILARPHDDKDIVESFMVSHERKTNFEIDYTIAKDKAKKNSEYCLDDVFAILEADGWVITPVEHITIIY